MSYTRNDILDYIKEEDVKFIRLAFTDPLGVRKNISVMPNELKDVFENGIAIEGNLIFKEEKEEYKKLFLTPDLDTISVLPWRPSQGRVVRMICHIKEADGSYYKCDSRKILVDVCEKLHKLNIDLKFQIKWDFYLFKLDELGNVTKVPYDNASYLDVAPLDKGENVRREICLSLSDMGLNPIASHHEVGPGQNRIYVEETEAINAADNNIAYITVVKNIASRNGLYADFSFKPLEKEINNNCLVEIDCGNNAKKYYDNLTNHYSEIELFLKPTTESYHVNLKVKLDGSRIIVETTASNMNPYIAYALITEAMLDEEKVSVKANSSLFDAIENAKASKLVAKVLPIELASYYYNLK